MASTTTRRRSSNGLRRSLSAFGAAGVASGAALVGVGAVATPQASAATKLPGLWFTCTADFFGPLALGTWGAEITTSAPSQVAPGQKIPDIKVTAKVTAGTLTSTTLQNLGVVSVKGTSVAPYKVFDKIYNANLTIPVTKVPTGSNLVTTATGTAPGDTAPTKLDTYPITVDGFSVSIVTTDKTGTVSTIPVQCVYRTGGAANQIGAIKVVGSTSTTSPTSSTSSTSPTSSTSSSSSTSEPTDTTSTTTTSEPTDTTSTTTTSEPTETTTTAEPTDTGTSSSSAPVITPSTVQTGSVGTTGSGNMLTAAGVGLAALGVVAVGGAVVVGRKREQQ